MGEGQIVFYILAGIALLGACMVIVAKNPVRAVLSLIMTFIATAGTWLLLEAEFLAMTLVVVYVGAVMVLFLFVVMMLDIKFATLKARFTKLLPLGITVAIAVMLLLLNVADKDHFTLSERGIPLAFVDGVSNSTLLGELVFTKYLLQFEIAGVILLVAIIAAIALIYRGPRNRKQQNISAQVAVKSSNRIRLVDGD